VSEISWERLTRKEGRAINWLATGFSSPQGTAIAYKRFPLCKAARPELAEGGDGRGIFWAVARAVVDGR